MLARNSQRWSRSGIQPASETHYVPGGSATGRIEPGNQRIVRKCDHLPLLRGENPGAIDELQFARDGRQPANAHPDVIRVLAVLLNVLGDERFIGEAGPSAVEG